MDYWGGGGGGAKGMLAPPPKLLGGGPGPPPLAPPLPTPMCCPISLLWDDMHKWATSVLSACSNFTYLYILFSYDLKGLLHCFSTFSRIFPNKQAFISEADC